MYYYFRTEKKIHLINIFDKKYYRNLNSSLGADFSDFLICLFEVQWLLSFFACLVFYFVVF